MSYFSRSATFATTDNLTGTTRYVKWVWLLLLGLFVGNSGSRVVGDFSHPLSDGNDTDQFEYVGYFFAKNLSFNPFPQLNLNNTQTFYPYGLNQVFLDWGFERDYWYRLCYQLFGGPGPYLQYYYVYTLVIAAIGAFLLLQPRFGVAKAIIAGLIVSIFNFYGLWKFPVHMNVCIGHWTTLCIIATYRLLSDILYKKPVSLAYVLVWMWLHVQILGQELGYVAGFALTFTTLTLPVLSVVLYRQHASRGLRPMKQQLINYVGRQWNDHKTAILFCLSLLVTSLYLYVPLTLQIALTAWQFDFGAVPDLRAWSHPARLFIPFLPGIDGYAIHYENWLHDTFEGYGQTSPGLYLTLLSAVGLWQIRRKIPLWLPVVLTLMFCLLYHPVAFPTLKLFPWFSFNRHGGRSSIVYPVLFCLLALPVKWPRQLPAQLGIVLLLGLMLKEWHTGYSLRLFRGTPVLADRVLRYCAIVHAQPGEAVLDWPFCTIGGDGVGGAEGLCPYYNQQNAVFTFRRFYDKSGVGQYLGRLHPDQIKPFLRDGWPQRLTSNRPFTEADWQFMDTFLRNNNFAGINLYPDLLPPQQVAGFYQRYGSPIAETRFPAAGRVVFIPLKK